MILIIFNIMKNYCLVYWIRSEENNIEENVNEFERNIFILNYHFSFLNFSIIFYLDNLKKSKCYLNHVVTCSWGF